VLDEIDKAKKKSGNAAETRSTHAATKVIDLPAALERLEGDRDLFSELAALFKAESPKMLDEARRAVASKNSSQLQHQAHTLKGAASNLGATGVSDAASELEKAARAGDMAHAGELLNALEKQVGLLFSELETVCAG